MPKIFLLSTLTLFTFIACQKRACPKIKTYNGLYNAITCDYKSENFNLEQNLSTTKSITQELQKKRKHLESEIYLQEKQLVHQKEQIKDREILLKNVTKEVDDINTKLQTKEILENLNLQIQHMHKVLKKKSY